MIHEYLTLQKLHAGLTVEIEGFKFRKIDGEIHIGDWYIAERNTGPKLLTAHKIVPYPTEENGLKYGGWIDAVEMAYSYDIPECIRVEMVV